MSGATRKVALATKSVRIGVASFTVTAALILMTAGGLGPIG